MMKAPSREAPWSLPFERQGIIAALNEDRARGLLLTGHVLTGHGIGGSDTAFEAQELEKLRQRMDLVGFIRICRRIVLARSPGAGHGRTGSACPD